MWVTPRRLRHLFVWLLEVDRPGSEHDEGQGGVGGVEAVGPPDEETDLGVELFHPAVLEMPCSTALRIRSQRSRMLSQLLQGRCRSPCPHHGQEGRSWDQTAERPGRPFAGTTKANAGIYLLTAAIATFTFRHEVG